MQRLIKWISNKFSGGHAAPPAKSSRINATLRQTGQHKVRPRKPVKPLDNASDSVEIETHMGGRIESNGPGKNVLVRKFVREDTGTHETLTILDENAVDSDEAAGIDPYNTGKFDRSKNWDKRRK